MTNISSNSQFISENKYENNNMSIPEYSSYSTIPSSSNSNYTIVNTKNGRNKNFNNCFHSDSDTETSQFNNMRRNKTPQKPTIQYYTINYTTDSDSRTSISKNCNNSKNSDMSYLPSTNDFTTFFSSNKIKDDRRNQRNSNKYIQSNCLQSYSKHNNTISTPQTTKIQNRKLRQKKKIIPTSVYLYQHKNKSQATNNQRSKGLVNKNGNMINTYKVINIDNINVRDNNNIGTNKEQYKNQQNNNTNSHTGEKQILGEEKYRSKLIRHLRSIESRIKKIKIQNIRL